MKLDDDKVLEKWGYLIGTTIEYISGSSKKYKATITDVPLGGQTMYRWPTVSLEFRNEIGKLVRKPRVLPCTDNWRTKVWRLLD